MQSGIHLIETRLTLSDRGRFSEIGCNSLIALWLPQAVTYFCCTIQVQALRFAMFDNNYFLLKKVHKEKIMVPTGCILFVGTVPTGFILTVGTVPMDNLSQKTYQNRIPK